MAKRILHVLCVTVVFLGLAACEKIPEQISTMEPVEGALRIEPVKFKDAIPMEYGNLVGVIPHPTQPGWAALWFERADKSIRVAWVNALNGDVYEKVVLIPRK